MPTTSSYRLLELSTANVQQSVSSCLDTQLLPITLWVSAFGLHEPASSSSGENVHRENLLVVDNQQESELRSELGVSQEGGRLACPCKSHNLDGLVELDVMIANTELLVSQLQTV